MENWLVTKLFEWINSEISSEFGQQFSDEFNKSDTTKWVILSQDGGQTWFSKVLTDMVTRLKHLDESDTNSRKTYLPDNNDRSDSLSNTFFYQLYSDELSGSDYTPDIADKLNDLFKQYHIAVYDNISHHVLGEYSSTSDERPISQHCYIVAIRDNNDKIIEYRKAEYVPL
jgi:hypothetical protein